MFLGRYKQILLRYNDVGFSGVLAVGLAVSRFAATVKYTFRCFAVTRLIPKIKKKDQRDQNPSDETKF